MVILKINAEKNFILKRNLYISKQPLLISYPKIYSFVFSFFLLNRLLCNFKSVL